MSTKATLIEAIYAHMMQSDALLAYLGEWQPDLVAVAYETIDEEYTVPESKGYIIYHLEGSTPRASESRMTLEKHFIRFFVAGNQNLEIVDELISLFDGIELAGFRVTFIGSTSIPKSPTNQTPAINARFEFI